jgi:hypothetical protein
MKSYKIDYSAAGGILKRNQNKYLLCIRMKTKIGENSEVYDK